MTTRIRMLIRLFTAAAVGAVWAAGCGHTVERSGNSNTNWLRSCDTDDECGGLECLCGVCTRSCDAQTCRAIDSLAACVTPGPSAFAACGRDFVDTALCTIACTRDADCATVSASLLCIGGACLAGSTRDARDAALPDGGPPPDGSTDASRSAPIRRCTTEADCGSGETCYEEAPPVSVCRKTCVARPDGGADECNAGEFCNGVCRRLCKPSSPGDCAEGEWCPPIAAGSPIPPFPGGPPLPPRPPEGFSTCVVGNDLKEGEACQSACGPNMECAFGSLFQNFGSRYCAPVCDTGTTDPISCSAGTCEQSMLTQGHCSRDCDAFGAATCPAGMSCYPFDQVTAEPFARVVHGRCITPGTLPEGSNCDHEAVGENTCAAGLACMQLPQPLQGTPACRRFCNPLQPSACNSDETCLAWNYGGDLGIGSCLKTCTLWAQDSPASGCAAGDWCAPRFTAKVGLCAHGGSVRIGESCAVDVDCAAGSVCRCQTLYDASNYLDNCDALGRPGHCERVCDPKSSPGGAGSCPNGSICFAAPLGPYTVTPASGVGFCQDTCDFDAHVACPNPDQICVPHELTGVSVDSCFDSPMPGQCLTNVCGSLSLCLAPDVSTECTNVCRAVAGAIGTTNHPDCPNPIQKCLPVPSTTAYGRCELP